MFLIDFLFPKFCLGCGYVGVYICHSCNKKLEPIDKDVCAYCKKASLFGLTHYDCTKTPNIDGLLSIYHYNPILKKIIKNIKYRLATKVWEDFYKTVSPQLIEKLSFYKRISPDFVIQPIPLSKIRYNDRGFNQAKTISIFFQKYLYFPIVNLLIRKKETSSQAQTKDKWSRKINVKDVFIASKTCKDAQIVLVDDIFTSGATVKAAAEVLKKAGAKKVYVLTLARG